MDCHCWQQVLSTYPAATAHRARVKRASIHRDHSAAGTRQRSKSIRSGNFSCDVDSGEGPARVEGPARLPRVLSNKHGGQPNSLFPEVGHYSQIRGCRVEPQTGAATAFSVASAPACENVANYLTGPRDTLLAGNCDRHVAVESPLLSSKSALNALHFAGHATGVKTDVVKIKQRIPFSEEFRCCTPREVASRHQLMSSVTAVLATVIRQLEIDLQPVRCTGSYSLERLPTPHLPSRQGQSMGLRRAPQRLSPRQLWEQLR